MVCYCPSHLHLQADMLTCSEEHPCNSWGTCSQKCTSVSSHRHKCSCFDGYELEDDGFSCKSMDGATPFVIFSNRHELRAIDLHSFNVRALISSLKNTIALDFYHAGNTTMVFWTDVIDDKIYRGTLIGGCKYLNIQFLYPFSTPQAPSDFTNARGSVSKDLKSLLAWKF